MVTVHHPGHEEGDDAAIGDNQEGPTVTGDIPGNMTGTANRHAKERARHCDTPTRLSFSDKVRKFSSREDGKSDL